MNIDMMKRTRARIASAGPNHCDMNWFIHSTGGKGAVVKGVGRLDCGTTACVAGFAIAVDRRVFTEDECWDIDENGLGADILGLETDGECPLFHKDQWPAHYYDMAKAQGDQPAMLALLDAMIDGTVVLDRKVWRDQDGNRIDDDHGYGYDT